MEEKTKKKKTVAATGAEKAPAKKRAPAKPKNGEAEAKPKNGEAAAKPKATRSKAVKKAEPAEPTTYDFAKAAARFALEKKATGVRILSLTGITSITDYFVVATGDSDPQVKAIAENISTHLREDFGQHAFRSEGWESLQWVILDYVDFVVHIFQTQARLFYNLERLWADAPVEEIRDELEPLTNAVKRSRKPAKLSESNEEEKTRKDDEPKIRIIDNLDAD